MACPSQPSVHLLRLYPLPQHPPKGVGVGTGMQSGALQTFLPQIWTRPTALLFSATPPAVEPSVVFSTEDVFTANPSTGNSVSSVYTVQLLAQQTFTEYLTHLLSDFKELTVHGSLVLLQLFRQRPPGGSWNRHLQTPPLTVLKITSTHVYVWVHMPQGTRGSQRTACMSQVFLFTMVNSVCQAWWQAPLPTEHLTTHHQLYKVPAVKYRCGETEDTASISSE